MKRTYVIWWAAICVAYGAIPSVGSDPSLSNLHDRPAYLESDRVQATANQFHGRFQDCTKEIVAHALALIDRNERESSALDRRWYVFRRFGENLEQILKAREVRFYGGREVDVLRSIASQYVSLAPILPDQDPSDVRLFIARRDTNGSDLVIIGQNGREVALKTVIRLIHRFKFTDPELKRTFPGGLDSFLGKVKIYLSSIPARQEFISFFQKYRIRDPDAVIIGFQRDTRAVLRDAGLGEPERYSSDSLRVNWYPNANGKKVLLVSINGNRIFASRAGDLIEAFLEAFRAPPRILIFFGSAGAIDSPKLVGHMVAPTVVVADDDFSLNGRSGKLAHIIRNRAAAIVPIKTAHVSVESMFVETLKWAATNRHRRIMTVDQELFHVINAVNASPYASNIQLFVGMFVTDNVAATAAPHEATLQYAEDVIARTAAIRRQFLTHVLADTGIIAHVLQQMPLEISGE
jgi:hypothetical protein